MNVRHTQRSNPRRKSQAAARISLALIATLALLIMVVGGGVSATSVLAQESPSPTPTATRPASEEPEITLLNPAQEYDPVYESPPRPPDTDDPVKVSDKFDGVDELYHIVAWVQNPPPTPVVEVYYNPGCVFVSGVLGCDFAEEETIGLMERVPGTDTWETFWDVPDDYTGGPATDGEDSLFIVRLYDASGAAIQQVAEDEVFVDIVNTEETVEMTWPVQNGQLGFYKGRGGAWRAVVDGRTSSANTQRVTVRYSTSDPGTTPEYTTCATINLLPDSDNPFKPWRVDCVLAEGDVPSELTALAAVAAEDDSPEEQCAPEVGCRAAEEEFTLESADVHRIQPYLQTPGQMTVTVFPAPISTEHTDQGRTVVDEDDCLSYLLRVRDHLDRPVQGANVDLHMVGPTDSIGFGDEPDAARRSSTEKAPDKGGHSSELQWDCEFPGDRINSQSQGDHNVPAGDDIKHIETGPAGSGLSAGAGVDAGEFRFLIFSDRVGLTDITAWIDDEELTDERANRDLDDDILEPGENTGTRLAQWYAVEPTIQFEPAGGSGVVGTCQKYTVRVRSGSAPVPRINVDVHASGPDDQLDFCDPADASARRAPEQTGPEGSPHEQEDSGESAHAGPPPRVQHTEGETDDAGNFVFGITSPASGDTNLLAWIDREPPVDNDVQDSVEQSVTATHAWGVSLADARIRFLNPSNYGGGNNEISNVRDADANYHLVARTDAAEALPGVEFLISSDGAAFTSLGLASRVGTTNTYELFWNANVPDGNYTLRVQIVGTNKIEDRAVVVNNEDPEDPPVPPDPAQDAAETAELTRPANGAPAPFVRSETAVAGVASAGAEFVEIYYTRSAAGDVLNANSWTRCARIELDGSEDEPQSFTGACELAAADQASQVRGIAAVAIDCLPPAGCDDPPGPAPSNEAKDSGDAHRVGAATTDPIIAIEPAEAATRPNACQRLEIRVVDQTGQAMVDQNVDVHVRGPDDQTGFCDPGDASPRRAPDGGDHTVDATDEQSGSHEDPAANTRHTEAETNRAGVFVFGVTSEVQGDVEVIAWAEENENDLQDVDEASDRSIVHFTARDDGGGGNRGCTITGTSGNDRLEGTEDDDVICGRGGDDTLIGGGGNDVVRGGPGKDSIRGGPGDDELRGSGGRDVIVAGAGNDTVSGGGGKDNVRGNDGTDDLSGGAKNDTLSGGSGDDLLRGNNGFDTLKGNAGNDRVDGQRGDDVLQGGGGRDVLLGRVNNDLIKGGGGRDRLFGHGGDDILDGGPGGDRCRGGSGNNQSRRCES